MLRRVALVRTDVSEEFIASIIRVTRSVLRLVLTAKVPSSPILVTRMMEAPSSSETSVLTRATRRNIPEDVILQDILHALNEALRYEDRTGNECTHLCFLDLYHKVVVSDELHVPAALFPWN
jgi:hypothetical protein